MDVALPGLFFGIWLGLTGAIAIHVQVSLITRHSQRINPSRQDVVFVRAVRFLAIPLLMLGLLGVASVLGQAKHIATFATVGMLVGLAAYGVLLKLYRRSTLVGAASPMSDRERWLNQWEMTRAGGRSTYMLQHTLIGLVLGFFAALALFAAQPHVGETNIGTLPWLLVVFLFFPAIIVLYARWVWNVAERQFHALRDGSGT